MKRAGSSCLALCVVTSLNAVGVASFRCQAPQHAPQTRPPSTHPHRFSRPLLSTAQDSTSTDREETRAKPKNKAPEVSRFLAEFRTARGTLVDPYKVLKLPRSASAVEIKQSYRKLSRKWHPDAVARKEILPGNCANLEDVREEWEKVKLSYEILIDRKTGLKYDRNSVVADPGAAVGRAVGGAVGNAFAWGVESVFRMVAGEKADAKSVDGGGSGVDGVGGGGSRQ
ncbi:hypothetical protein HJC23_011133 [Cyclotella cryptica]|uniref:J domain-containing protein n=1 Tax=Cyclotella cryptica TaxID=29204 RepID=A0ABD3P0U0_9STRA|eukprot:CCRYP_018255-RA/>CCRYP_018255-RA protein AED:0.00 eAED:0.00 QI:283/1/1/1/1/1/2/702/226